MSNIQGSILQTMSVISKITAAKNLAKKAQNTDTKTTDTKTTETKKTEVADPNQFKNFLASEKMKNALQQRRQEILNQQPIIDTMKGEDDN